MTLPELNRWVEYGEGRWWVSRYEAAEALRREALEAAMERPPPPTLPPGVAWRGGPCDPADSGIYVDEDEAA